MELLIKTFTEYKDQALLSLARELANQLEGIVSLLNIVEDNERLRKEVEELRKENERLRDGLKKQVIVNNAKEAFTLFARLVTQEAEQQLSKETYDHLITILTHIHGIFNGNGKLNWEKIKELAMVIR